MLLELEALEGPCSRLFDLCLVAICVLLFHLEGSFGQLENLIQGSFVRHLIHGEAQAYLLIGSQVEGRPTVVVACVLDGVVVVDVGSLMLLLKHLPQSELL